MKSLANMIGATSIVVRTKRKRQSLVRRLEEKAVLGIELPLEKRRPEGKVVLGAEHPPETDLRIDAEDPLIDVRRIAARIRGQATDVQTKETRVSKHMSEKDMLQSKRVYPN
jgi:hypothetical protein